MALPYLFGSIRLLNPCRSLAAGLTLAMGLTACSFLPTEYKIDIQQGNAVTQDMVNQLRPGLTRQQVRFIMGSPLLTDIFHADRWDYLYSMNYRSSEGTDQRRLISVYFDRDGKLTSVSGDVRPVSAAELPPNKDIPREIEVDRKAP